jgi:hypothetical protein
MPLLHTEGVHENRKGINGQLERRESNKRRTK